MLAACQAACGTSRTGWRTPCPQPKARRTCRFAARRYRSTPRMPPCYHSAAAASASASRAKTVSRSKNRCWAVTTRHSKAVQRTSSHTFLPCQHILHPRLCLARRQGLVALQLQSSTHLAACDAAFRAPSSGINVGRRSRRIANVPTLRTHASTHSAGIAVRHGALQVSSDNIVIAAGSRRHCREMNVWKESHRMLSKCQTVMQGGQAAAGAVWGVS